MAELSRQTNDFTVIFDMDGVILDSERIYQQIEWEMYTEIGAAVSREEHLAYMGTAERWMWTKVVQKHGLDKKVEELVQEERKRFISKLKEPGTIPLMEGLIPLLEELKDRQIPCLIASSSARYIIGIMLECKDLSAYFTAYVGGDEVRQAKPSPDLYLEAVRIAGSQPGRSIAIEDSPNGIRSASAAGLPVIGLRHPGHELDMSLANLTINSLRELDTGRLQILLKQFHN